MGGLDSDHFMRVPIFYLWVLPLLLGGCGNDAANMRDDNPAIRRRQSSETDRHIGNDAYRSALEKRIGERVGFVFTNSSDGSPDSKREGRAAVVTSDGYFLTAYHVVQDSSFFFKDDTRPDHGRMVGRRHQGRLVWCDPAIDLAVVKFPVQLSHFTHLKVPVDDGEVVFAADDEGHGTLVANEEGIYSLGTATGNGSFFAAGEIVGTPERSRGTEGYEISTTLVARAGMSGSPLVTRDGELCGIITRVEWGWLGKFRKTVATMIEPDLLFKIIEADRKQRMRGDPSRRNARF